MKITNHVPAVRVPLVTRMASWLRLPRREEAWKTAEILLLRHQLAARSGGSLAARS